MRYIGELHRPDVALLPIGGHFTMGPRQAAVAVELLGVSHVIPIHYGTFDDPRRDAGSAPDRARGPRPEEGAGPRPRTGQIALLT